VVFENTPPRNGRENSRNQLSISCLCFSQRLRPLPKNSVISGKQCRQLMALTRQNGDSSNAHQPLDAGRTSVRQRQPLRLPAVAAIRGASVRNRAGGKAIAHAQYPTRMSFRTGRAEWAGVFAAGHSRNGEYAHMKPLPVSGVSLPTATARGAS